jgi:S-adenosylmethionine decarboxylase
MHLIVDGYGSDPKLMQGETFLYHLLDSYPSQIGMTKLSAPFVFKYVNSNPQDWGISGFVLIAESHISVHTFAERCYVNIDVFSCRDFDAEKVIEDFRDKFRLTRLKTCVVDREWEIADAADVNEPIEFRLFQR